ncbi:hypothetical protein O7606_03020 [Micromonospora sp. WMMD882]|uniref:hypothetical protein n=1 Tax=Micromonospora sp. WMMD882 TaxID=3015151 RepID=UPI00248C1705|nr:hypothetical protein [Micromonospora sp. WMMD882]WBB80367.1 hypothetical protein O7606_03020 [Micromonospora sp. WMMD882]
MTDITPDHFPAHVKSSYVNCSEYARAARLTPPPAATATTAADRPAVAVTTGAAVRS